MKLAQLRRIPEVVTDAVRMRGTEAQDTPLASPATFWTRRRLWLAGGAAAFLVLLFAWLIHGWLATGAVISRERLRIAEVGRGHFVLKRIFDTIGERAAHLATFIEGYGRFAKLPRPRPEPVAWAPFLARLEGTTPFRLEGALPAEPGSFDSRQLEQVMINLLKNAAESGSPSGEITVGVQHAAAGFRIEVADRGTGLTESTLRDALLPFYSTKPAGTGLGLTLCREIVEAHGGRLSLANRAGGGALVTVWLP